MFGLIGAGRWAQVHKEALESLEHRLACVLVSSEASKKRVERDWGVRATTEMQGFLSYGGEAVIIASPNYLHDEHAALCLNAGKHVLVEKPMAITLAGCDRILEAARRSGKVLAVGLEMRVFTLFAKVKELLDAGAVGKPIYLKLDLWRRPYREGAGGWKGDPAKLGSSILEEPVHYLDLARWYLKDAWGEPSSVQAWATSRPGKEDLWENLDVRLEFSGARAIVTRSIAAYGHHVYLELVGETGSLRASWEGRFDLDFEPQVALWLHTSGERDAYAERPEVPVGGHAFDLSKQTRAFIEAIRKGSPPAATGVDGRASVALCLAVERSLHAGRPIHL